MNFKYEELFNWFNGFAHGKNFILPISTIIAPGTELGSLINTLDKDSLFINIIVFNNNHIIQAECKLDENNIENDYANIKVYKIDNIKMVELGLSDSKYTISGLNFSRTVCKLYFSDGNVLQIHSSDFPKQQVDFIDTISSLISL